jgi:hypothetical protein
MNLIPGAVTTAVPVVVVDLWKKFGGPTERFVAIHAGND